MITSIYLEKDTDLYKELLENELFDGDESFTLFLEHKPSVGEFLCIGKYTHDLGSKLSEYLSKNKKVLNLKITELMSGCFTNIGVEKYYEGPNFTALYLKCVEHEFLTDK